MAQHSLKWPACPECRHNGDVDEHGHPCLGCRDADRFAPSCPGEAGEVVDYTAWAEDTMAACAEAKHVL